MDSILGIGLGQVANYGLNELTHRQQFEHQGDS